MSLWEEMVDEALEWRLRGKSLIKFGEKYNLSNRDLNLLFNQVCHILGDGLATFTDDFNRADSGDLGANWVEVVGGGMSILTNQLRGQNGDLANCRMANALDSDAHYAEIKVMSVTGQTLNRDGPTVRNSTDAAGTEDYQGFGFRTETTVGIHEIVNGSLADLAGPTTITHTSGDTYRCDVSADDVLNGYQNGTLRVGPVTDTSLAGLLRGGVRSRSNTLFDDFAAADGGAATAQWGGAAPVLSGKPKTI